MKKVILSMMLVGCTTIAYAQQTPKENRRKELKKEMLEKHQERWEQTKKELQLSPEQEAKIKALRESQAKGRKEQMLKERKVRQEQHQAFQQKNEKEMKKILSADQYKKWQDMKANRKDSIKAYKMKKVKGKGQF
ncbi:hypothetical protein [Elizabethkingia sp. JS20170427COW]|uniref:hypothetical protein n=1 Tax=Elizabethkingia sp. JS20170427COW TaxID=2583851 RepID=UPI001110104C|nr:hypothetical protein [Elizabethkingia sp. JS20170427COW]QCX53406.1 hypothetical protein FGE20_06480 [Elizabethkingia sp. JS20170427COW]